VEYRKAARLMGDKHPVLQTRLAQSLLATGKAKEAFDALVPVRDTFPTYVTTWIQLGRAAYELGRYPEAAEHLNEAARINPFDPEVHSRLALVYEKLGDADGARKAREMMQLVSGPAQ
jgi:Flp pilus assembly protein TadD